MNWATAFCKVFNSCVCWLLSLNPRKPASCLGQIPVYHPKGISLTHSIVHRSHSWTHSLPNTSNTWTFCFLFSRGFWQEIWWTGTSTTRWAGRSLATRWSSTISIENRFRRKGQSFLVRKSNIIFNTGMFPAWPQCCRILASFVNKFREDLICVGFAGANIFNKFQVLK